MVQGITGKAHKWWRHDWQGSSRPLGHVDLWTQLLQETELQGLVLQWLHVPSHIGIDGNTNAGRLADLGRRRSLLLRGQATVSRTGSDHRDSSDTEPESDLDTPWDPAHCQPRNQRGREGEPQPPVCTLHQESTPPPPSATTCGRRMPPPCSMDTPVSWWILKCAHHCQEHRACPQAVLPPPPADDSTTHLSVVCAPIFVCHLYPLGL